MSSFVWLDVVDESGGGIVDATSGTKGIIKLTNDLGGSADLPAVNKINGSSVPAGGALTNGQLLRVNGIASLGYGALDLTNSNSVTGILPNVNLPDASNIAKGIIQLAGDIGGTAALPIISKINGSSIPAGGSLTSGQILKVTGAANLGYGALDLSNANSITGTLSSSNLPDATTSTKGITQLSGDLGGTAILPLVLKINGTSISASPSANQVLIASSSSVSLWSQIVDANISSSAAIVGSKLAYTDNVSPILGAITVQTALDAIKTQAVATSIQRLSQTVNTATLQTAGAVLTSSFNIGSILPTNARVLGVEINVTQILAGLGLSVAVVTVQGSGDITGSLIASSTLLSTGLYGGTGTNRYLSRGGQQLTATVTLTGALLSALTAGSFTVNVFYAVVL